MKHVHFAESGENWRPRIPRTIQCQEVLLPLLQRMLSLMPREYPGWQSVFVMAGAPYCSAVGLRGFLQLHLVPPWVFLWKLGSCKGSWSVMMSVTLVSVSVSSNTVHKNGAKSSVHVLLNLPIPRKRGHIKWKVEELAEFLATDEFCCVVFSPPSAIR